MKDTRNGSFESNRNRMKARAIEMERERKKTRTDFEKSTAQSDKHSFCGNEYIMVLIK